MHLTKNDDYDMIIVNGFCRYDDDIIIGDDARHKGAFSI